MGFNFGALMNELTQRVSNIIKCVCKDLYDREDVVRIVVLTILAGQNVVLFGPPGTGKSMISRKVAGIFENSKDYEHLMHRFCTPEELFGPVSLKQLKNDQYVRLTEGYLASADFAFLDEISEFFGAAREVIGRKARNCMGFTARQAVSGRLEH